MSKDKMQPIKAWGLRNLCTQTRRININMIHHEEIAAAGDLMARGEDREIIPITIIEGHSYTDPATLRQYLEGRISSSISGVDNAKSAESELLHSAELGVYKEILEMLPPMPDPEGS